MSIENLSVADPTTLLSQAEMKHKTDPVWGCYVYGIVDGEKNNLLGQIGIDNSLVYTITYNDIKAVVHDCPAVPFYSKDEELVKEWVKTHQRVLDTMKKIFGTVVPLRFNVIVKPQPGSAANPQQTVQAWLKSEYPQLKKAFKKIVDKDEYAVQVNYDLKAVEAGLLKENTALLQMQKEMGTKSIGAAYLYQHKLTKTIKNEMESLARTWYFDFCQRIRQYCADIVVDPVKKTEGDSVMLLNLSCLVSREQVQALGEELERIAGEEGFSIHFSGPWPPYSFVTVLRNLPDSDKAEG